MKTTSFQQIPSKINKLFEKENLKESPKNNRKNVRNSSQKLSNKEEEIQLNLKRNQIDIHSQAFQTLTDVSLNVKDLLNDFLNNAKIDDTGIYNVEDEFKRNKNNKLKHSLNIYTLIDGNDSDNEKNRNKNQINIRKEDYLIQEKNNGIFNSDIKRKRNIVFGNNLEINNSKSRRIFFKNKNYNIFKNEKILPNLKRNSFDSFLKKNNLILHNHFGKNMKNYLKKNQSSKNHQVNNFILDKNINHENFDNEQFENKIKKNEKVKSFSSFQIQNLNNLMNKTSISLGKEINKISNSGYSLFKIENIDKNNSLLEKNNHKKYKNDKSDIRNYIHLSSKDLQKFNFLCEGLKKNIIISKDKNEENNQKNTTIINIEQNKKFKEEKEINESKNNLLIREQSINDKDYKIKEFQFRRLIRQNNNVYDSFSDDELLEEIEGNFYINPHGLFIFFMI